MVFRKHNSTAGFSLIEVLVAITILGFVAVPIGSSLVRAFELNARSEQMLQAQLAVSSTVETIMAVGYDETAAAGNDNSSYAKRFPDVVITDLEDGGAAYHITVTSKDHEAVSVTTYVRGGGS